MCLIMKRAVKTAKEKQRGQREERRKGLTEELRGGKRKLGINGRQKIQRMRSKGMEIVRRRSQGT